MGKRTCDLFPKAGNVGKKREKELNGRRTTLIKLLTLRIKKKARRKVRRSDGGGKGRGKSLKSRVNLQGKRKTLSQQNRSQTLGLGWEKSRAYLLFFGGCVKMTVRVQGFSI